MNWVDYAIGGTLALLVAWLSVLAYIVIIDWHARKEKQRREELYRWRQTVDALRRIYEQEGRG
jgi:purine-cytosine permease-like protein